MICRFGSTRHSHIIFNVQGAPLCLCGGKRGHLTLETHGVSSESILNTVYNFKCSSAQSVQSHTCWNSTATAPSPGCLAACMLSKCVHEIDGKAVLEHIWITVQLIARVFEPCLSLLQNTCLSASVAANGQVDQNLSKQNGKMEGERSVSLLL